MYTIPNPLLRTIGHFANHVDARQVDHRFKMWMRPYRITRAVNVTPCVVRQEDEEDEEDEEDARECICNAILYDACIHHMAQLPIRALLSAICVLDMRTSYIPNGSWGGGALPSIKSLDVSCAPYGDDMNDKLFLSTLAASCTSLSMLNMNNRSLSCTSLGRVIQQHLRSTLVILHAFNCTPAFRWLWQMDIPHMKVLDMGETCMPFQRGRHSIPFLFESTDTLLIANFFPPHTPMSVWHHATRVEHLHMNGMIWDFAYASLLGHHIVDLNCTLMHLNQLTQLLVDLPRLHTLTVTIMLMSDTKQSSPCCHPSLAMLPCFVALLGTIQFLHPDSAVKLVELLAQEMDITFQDESRRLSQIYSFL